MSTVSRCAVTGLSALLLAAAGCQNSYSVDLRNQTDQPITAELIWPQNQRVHPSLRTVRIGPGDRDSLGTVWAPRKKTVTLDVDFEGNIGHPAELPLAPGRTVVNVVRVDEGAKGRIRLEEVAPR